MNIFFSFLEAVKKLSSKKHSSPLFKPSVVITAGVFVLLSFGIGVRSFTEAKEAFPVSLELSVTSNSLYALNGKQFQEPDSSSEEILSKQFIKEKDTLTTYLKPLSLTFNSLSKITLAPKSSLKIISGGLFPEIELLSGEVEVQTSTQVKTHTKEHSFLTSHGGMSLSLEKQIFHTHYGNNVFVTSSQNFTSVPRLLELDLKKVSKESSSLLPFLTKNMVTPPRMTFMIPNEDSFSPIQVSSFQKHLSFTEKSQYSLKIQEREEIFSSLKEALQNTNLSEIQNAVQKLKKENMAEERYTEILALNTSPITQYLIETEITPLFTKTEFSKLQTQFRYLYTFLFNSDEKSTKKIQEDIAKELGKTQNNLKEAEDAYTILMSFFKTSPEYISTELIPLKKNLEGTILALLSPTKEKQKEFAYLAQEDTLTLVFDCVKRNYKAQSEILFQSINTSKNLKNFSTDTIKNLYAESQSLLQFQNDHLHASAFSEKDFKQYLSDKEKTQLAQKVYQSIFTQEGQKSSFVYSAQNIVKDFSKNSLQLTADNVSLLSDEQESVYVSSVKHTGTQEIFHAVYFPKKKILKNILWEKGFGTEKTPPFPLEVSLHTFSSKYTSLMKKIEAEKKEGKDVKPVHDWTEIAENIQAFSFEDEVKRQTVKEKLESYNIFTQNKFISIITETTAQVKDAKITLDGQNSVLFHTELTLPSFEVLSVTLKDYPERPVEIPNIENLFVTVKDLFTLIQKENEALDKAYKDIFPYITEEHDAKENKMSVFSIVDSDTPHIVQITNLPLEIGGYEYNAQGSYNTLSRQFPSLRVQNESTNVTKYNIPVNEIGNFFSYTAPSRNIDTLDFSSYEDIIKQELNSLYEGDLDEYSIEDYLDNGDWINF